MYTHPVTINRLALMKYPKRFWQCWRRVVVLLLFGVLHVQLEDQNWVHFHCRLRYVSVKTSTPFRNYANKNLVYFQYHLLRNVNYFLVYYKEFKSVITRRNYLHFYLHISYIWSSMGFVIFDDIYSFFSILMQIEELEWTVFNFYRHIYCLENVMFFSNPTIILFNFCFII